MRRRRRWPRASGIISFALGGQKKIKNKKLKRTHCVVFLSFPCLEPAQPNPTQENKESNAVRTCVCHPIAATGRQLRSATPLALSVPPLLPPPPRQPDRGSEGRYPLCVVISTTGYLAHPWGPGLGSKVKRRNWGEGGGGYCCRPLEETLDERKYFSYNTCVHVYVLLPHKRESVCVSATLPPSETLSSVRQSA